MKRGPDAVERPLSTTPASESSSTSLLKKVEPR